MSYKKVRVSVPQLCLTSQGKVTNVKKDTNHVLNPVVKENPKDGRNSLETSKTTIPPRRSRSFLHYSKQKEETRENRKEPKRTLSRRGTESLVSTTEDASKLATAACSLQLQKLPLAPTPPMNNKTRWKASNTRRSSSSRTMALLTLKQTPAEKWVSQLLGLALHVSPEHRQYVLGSLGVCETRLEQVLQRRRKSSSSTEIHYLGGSNYSIDKERELHQAALEGAAILKHLELDSKALHSKGMDDKTVEKLYRSLQVYSTGAYEALVNSIKHVDTYEAPKHHKSIPKREDGRSIEHIRQANASRCDDAGTSWVTTSVTIASSGTALSHNEVAMEVGENEKGTVSTMGDLNQQINNCDEQQNLTSDEQQSVEQQNLTSDEQQNLADGTQISESANQDQLHVSGLKSKLGIHKTNTTCEGQFNKDKTHLSMTHKLWNLYQVLLNQQLGPDAILKRNSIEVTTWVQRFEEEVDRQKEKFEADAEKLTRQLKQVTEIQDQTSTALISQTKEYDELKRDHFHLKQRLNELHEHCKSRDRKCEVVTRERDSLEQKNIGLQRQLRMSEIAVARQQEDQSTANKPSSQYQRDVRVNDAQTTALITVDKRSRNSDGEASIVATLKQVIASHEIENNNLNEQLLKARHDLVEKAATTEEYRMEKMQNKSVWHKMEHKVQDGQKQLSEYEEKLGLLSNKLRESEEQLQQSRTEFENLNIEFKTTTESFNSVTNQFRELESKWNSRNGSTVVLKETIEKLETELSLAKTKVVALENEAQTQVERYTGLQEELQKMIHAKQQLVSNQDKLIKSRARAEKQCQSYREIASSSRKSVESFVVESAMLKQQLFDKTIQHSELNGKLNESENTITLLQHEIEKLKENGKFALEASREVECLKVQSKKFEEQIKVLDKQIADKEDNLVTGEAKLAKLYSILQAFLCYWMNACKMCEKISSCQIWNPQVTAFQSINELLTGESEYLITMRNTHDALVHQVQCIHNDFSTQQSKLAFSETEANNLRGEVGRLSKALGDIQERFEAKVLEISLLEQRTRESDEVEDYKQCLLEQKHESCDVREVDPSHDESVTYSRNECCENGSTSNKKLLEEPSSSTTSKLHVESENYRIALIDQSTQIPDPDNADSTFFRDISTNTQSSSLPRLNVVNVVLNRATQTFKSETIDCGTETPDFLGDGEFVCLTCQKEKEPEIIAMMQRHELEDKLRSKQEEYVALQMELDQATKVITSLSLDLKKLELARDETEKRMKKRISRLSMSTNNSFYESIPPDYTEVDDLDDDEVANKTHQLDDKRISEIQKRASLLEGTLIKLDQSSLAQEQEIRILKESLEFTEQKLAKTEVELTRANNTLAAFGMDNKEHGVDEVLAAQRTSVLRASRIRPRDSRSITLDDLHGILPQVEDVYASTEAVFHAQKLHTRFRRITMK